MEHYQYKLFPNYTKISCIVIISLLLFILVFLIDMKLNSNHILDEVLRKIAEGRKRTNLFRGVEQKFLAFLVQIIPNWITPNFLTFVGFVGSIIISLSFVFASLYNELFLLIAVFGFFVNWFGDSLDGRLAYYRNRPRRWYGYVLDINVDFLGIVLIGLGFIYYAEGFTKILGYLFVTLYSWEFIIVLIRFKLSGEYSIDSGLFSPTEVRVVVSVIIIFEIFFQGSISYFAGIACCGLFLENIFDILNLLKLANQKDTQDNK
ncbi:MAG: CDP-alcohol phosphatidyltransferase family protein [Candidatus Kapaibacteriales bacterium]